MLLKILFLLMIEPIDRNVRVSLYLPLNKSVISCRVLPSAMLRIYSICSFVYLRFCRTFYAPSFFNLALNVSILYFFIQSSWSNFFYVLNHFFGVDKSTHCHHLTLVNLRQC